MSVDKESIRKELECKIYELNTLENYKYVVVCTYYKGQWLLSRHKDRETWETQGGHIENFETPLMAAKRELYEEAGVRDAEFYPICDYLGYNSISSSNGMVFLAIAKNIGKLPNSEMKETRLFSNIPNNLTYPNVSPILYKKACEYLEDMMYLKAKKFIYQNARPLDLARWKFHFESGDKNEILKYLEVFQNDDGGFGYGLELDTFNPNSSPIQTWKAIVRLEELGIYEKDNPVIKKILRYLNSGKDFDEKTQQWMIVVPTNNDYPHAIWWEYKDDNFIQEYNPTACFAGFIIYYADKNTDLYKKGVKIAKSAFNWLKVNKSNSDSIKCFMQLYNYLKLANINNLIDLTELANLIKNNLINCICKDVSKWYEEYVDIPSYIFKNINEEGVKECITYIKKEIDILPYKQLDDGSFGITWKWWTDYPEWQIARHFWLSDIIIEKLLFYRKFKNL